MSRDEVGGRADGREPDPHLTRCRRRKELSGNERLPKSLETLQEIESRAIQEIQTTRLSQWSLEHRGPEILVLLAVRFNLWVLRAERLPVAYPNDSSVHLQMVAFAQHLLSSGQFPLDHWYPYLSLGSPFFVQYQSASAIITGASDN